MQKHGGDIYNHRVKLDFSVNVNPFGMPDSVRQAAIQGVMQSENYPDIECNELKHAIATKEAVKNLSVCVGNGAAELIFQLVFALKPKKALVLAPTFGEYEQALQAVECEIITYNLLEEDKFVVKKDIMSKIDPTIDLVMICNPNNPTGELMEEPFLKEMLEHCDQMHTFFMVDECFQNFITDSEQVFMKKYLNDYENFFILKAFTKMYGMAGLRLGYGLCSNVELIEHMKQMCQPWNVSIPAQMAGIAACQEIEYEKMTCEIISKEKKRLIQALETHGFTVYGSKANYIFFHGTYGLYEKFLEHGILIRSCKSYHGLSDNFYRICVKTRNENDEFIRVLEKIDEIE